jgi:hypothetical protein
MSNKGSGLMDILFNMKNRPVVRCSGLATILIALLSARHCPAQQSVIGSLIMTRQQSQVDTLELQGGNTNSWMQGQSVNLVIAVTAGSNTFQVTQGQNPGDVMSLSIWQWPQYPTNYSEGPPDTNINLSNFHYIDATHIGFTATVTSGVPNGVDQLDLVGSSARWVWPIFIEPTSPPPTPGVPGPNPNCAMPSIASVIPDTWIAGQTYPIKIMGSGFSSDAQATTNPNCPANQLTVTVPTGTVTVSDVHVINSTEIDATVAPANTDPDEQATLNLYFRPPNESVVRNPGKSPTALATAKPQDNGAPRLGFSAGECTD